MNDTGSDKLLLLDSDIDELGSLQQYTGLGPQIQVTFANGTQQFFRSIFVQVQLVDNENLPWSDWIEEHAIIMQDGPTVVRLSGPGLRNAMYIATAPGNQFLAVSATKGGLTSLL